MPELSRFFGIIIRMYSEPGGQHHLPHFHAHFDKRSALFTLDPVGIIGGEIPIRQRRFVEAWAEIHKEELVQAWISLQHGEIPSSIDPLK